MPTHWTHDKNGCHKCNYYEGEHNITLLCPVCGHPEPFISHVMSSFDSEIIEGNNGIFISNIMMDSEGHFTCSLDGGQNVIVTVHVKTVPALGSKYKEW